MEVLKTKWERRFLITIGACLKVKIACCNCRQKSLFFINLCRKYALNTNMKFRVLEPSMLRR